MKTPEREALRWYLQAEDDLKFVEWVAREGTFFDKGCFISQQAGEKALKACLYALGRRRILGHSLHDMIGELTSMEPKFLEAASPAKRLDRFYIAARYPNGIPGGSPFQLYDANDLSEALEDLKLVFGVCRQFLQSKGALQT